MLATLTRPAITRPTRRPQPRRRPALTSSHQHPHTRTHSPPPAPPPAMSKPNFWATPFRYMRYASHEHPAIFYSIVMGFAGPALLVAVPIRRALGFDDSPPLPMTWPSEFCQCRGMSGEGGLTTARSSQPQESAGTEHLRRPEVEEDVGQGGRGGESPQIGAGRSILQCVFSKPPAAARRRQLGVMGSARLVVCLWIRYGYGSVGLDKIPQLMRSPRLA